MYIILLEQSPKALLNGQPVQHRKNARPLIKVPRPDSWGPVLATVVDAPIAGSEPCFVPGVMATASVATGVVATVTVSYQGDSTMADRNMICVFDSKTRYSAM